MKILLVETAISGHRLGYIKALLKCCNAEFILALPEKTILPCKQYIVPFDSINNKRSLRRYNIWLRKIRKIEKKEKPDITHFLYGDAFYRYFGVFLWHYKKKGLTTLHLVRDGFLQQTSLRCVCRKFNRVVVHSKYLQQDLSNINIQNTRHIEYPEFNTLENKKEESCAFFGMRTDIPVLLCLGATRGDKGLDLLLEALRKVKKPFQLLVAGKEEDIKKEFILEHSTEYRDSVFLYLQYLSDEELGMALAASDIVCIPYRKSFNAASGPLGEGVTLNKCIIGPNHGNLGKTIKDNHLGYVFESENINDLSRVINQALVEGFQPDELFEQYRNSLDVFYFMREYAGLYNEMTGSI